ncbi:hypothetical protein [Frankia sp. EAN1pec]
MTQQSMTNTAGGRPADTTVLTSCDRITGEPVAALPTMAPGQAPRVAEG